MAARTLNAVVLRGAVLTALLVGIATAVTQAKWVYAPAVALGVCGTIVAIYHDWENSSYRREVGRFVTSPRSLVVFVLLGSVGIQAVVIYLLSAFLSQAGDHPCLCLGDERGLDWFNLTLGAGGGTYLETAGLFLSLLALRTLVLRREMQ